MRYSPLIRHLVKATGEARIAGQDLASRLSPRFQEESDVIRNTLFHAVCDPRFMLHADGTVKWSSQAKKHLEAFAARLMRIDGLTTEIAQELMDDFLDDWFRLMMNSLEENFKEFNPVPTITEDEDYKNSKKLKDTLDLFMKQTEPEGQEEEKEDENISKFGFEDELYKDSDETIASEENDKETPDNYNGDEINEELDKDIENNTEESGEEDTDSDEKEEESAGKGEEENKDDVEKPRFGRGGGKGNRMKIENRFLRKLPPSLMELVKRIGRTGDDVFETSGSFPTASKSDITGITVGNDLNSVLPSELALLAHPNTEHIFLNNFVSKRLQVFASASSGRKAGKKEENGPIIICLDTSGSMFGEPVIVAKALTMAISIIAQRQKRKMILVKYSDSYEGMVITKFSRQSAEVKAFLNEFETGGNNESKMFGWLFNELIPTVDKDFKSADILCITDFGWSSIHSKVMDVIQDYKKQGMRWYGLNINPDRFFTDEEKQLLQLIDSLWNYDRGKCIEVALPTVSTVRSG